MGVYIPNMSKPKDCKECQWHLDFYIEDKQVGGLCTITEKDDKENTCPIIDIVTCAECKHYGFKETDRGGFPCCTNVIGATPYRMPTDFCSYGERRADEGVFSRG